MIHHAVEGITLAARSWPCTGPVRPATVLLPGTGATAADWDVIASDLSRDRDVFALDLRGHGASGRPGVYSVDLMARDVAAVLPGLAPVVDIVGHSLGGLVGCHVARRAPTVRRLVLEDVGVLHPRAPADPARPEGELDFDWAVVEQVRPEIDDPDPGWPALLSRLGVPVLAISGGPSSFVPQQHVEELVALVPQGTGAVIDAGHAIHETRPEEFLEHVRAFLDR